MRRFYYILGRVIRKIFMFKKRKRAQLCTPSVYINYILSDIKNFKYQFNFSDNITKAI